MNTAPATMGPPPDPDPDPATAAPALAPRPATTALRRPRGRRDALVVLAVTLGCYALAAAFDLSERTARWLARSEGWQADELPLTLGVLASALAWFAWRRRREALAELRLREAAEARASELLGRNRDLARRLIDLQESERRAMARELHDELGQACSAIRAETAFIRHCVASDGAGDGRAAPATIAAIAAAAARADAEAERLYERVRQMLRRLRPADLDSLGLVAALQELCESWEARSGVGCTFHHDGLPGALGDAVDIAVYRVVQEALANVQRHAGASGVRIRLGVAAHGLRLSVHDDGRGFDPARSTRGLGLLGATERAAALGGTLHVGAAAGGGTTLEMRLPLAAAASADAEGAAR